MSFFPIISFYFATESETRDYELEYDLALGGPTERVSNPSGERRRTPSDLVRCRLVCPWLPRARSETENGQKLTQSRPIRPFDSRRR